METRPDEIDWESSDSALLLNPKMTEEERAGFVRLVATRLTGPRALSGHVWIASSGTTGAAPKVIGLAKPALLASAAGVNSFFRVTATDVWGLALPAFHVGGLGILVRARLNGAQVTGLSGAWNALEAIEWMKRESVTLVSLVPTQLYDIVILGLRAPPSVRAAILGGAALDSDLRARAEVLGWPVVATFGMSEGASMIAADGAIPGVMTLLPHWEARTDADGLLELKGPALFTTSGQWVDGEARWHDRTDVWWKTSDRVRLRGREISWLGRDDDFIKIKGEGVSLPLLLEELNAFLRAEAASFTAVGLFGIEDERRGFILAAALQATDWFGPMGNYSDKNVPAMFIKKFNANRLSHEHIARSVLRTAWPRTSLGKLRALEARQIILNSTD